MEAKISQDFLSVFSRLSTQLGDIVMQSNPWQGQFQSGNIKQAAEQIQNAMSADGSSLIARLWWIEAERQVGEVPQSALCSPLEEALERIGGDVGLKLLAGGICLNLAVSLVENAQTRLAVLLLRRAFPMLVSTRTISRDDQTALCSAYTKLIDCEIERAKVRQEKPSYLEDLQAERKKLREFKPNPDVSPIQSFLPSKEKKDLANDKEPHVTRPVDLSSKSILQNASRMVEEGNIGSRLEASSGEEEKLRFVLDSDSSTEIQQPDPRVLKSNFRVITLSFCLLFAVGGYYFFSLRGEGVDYAIPLPEVRVLDDKLVLPSLAFVPVNPRSVGEKAMDSVIEKLSNVGDKSSSGDKKHDGKKDSEIDKEAMEMATAVTHSQEPPKNEIAKIEKDEREVLHEKAPPIDAQRLGQTKVEDIGGGERSPNSQRLSLNLDKMTIAGDGRRYGPSPDGDNSSAVDPKSRLPVQSYEVKQFSPPKIFVMLNDTVVSSAPSMVSVEVSKLRKGDKVEVVSSMGPWLELRSERGKRGYIYSQDAKEQ